MLEAVYCRESQFYVTHIANQRPLQTKYTMAANPGPGYLCHQCAKQGGANPFKKPAAPVKREKRPLPVIEERRISSLVSHCVEVL
jgi:DNA repair protein RAD7